MNILKLNQLNNNQIVDINELAALCNNYDPYYDEFSANGETCFFLYYEDLTLVSFLSFLAVSSSDFTITNDTTSTELETELEAEITAITHPDSRRQGLFSVLLKCALTEINILGITNIYCAIPAEYQSSSMCKSLSHCEYLQRLNIDSINQLSINSDPFQSNQKHLHYTNTPAMESEVPFAYHLTEKKFFTRSKSIGVCHLSEEQEFTNIWGIEIKKPYRNQGYGLKLMNFVIHDYFKHSVKPLILNVKSTNTFACKLYNRCGFNIVEQIEYYNLNVTD